MKLLLARTCMWFDVCVDWSCWKCFNYTWDTTQRWLLESTISLDVVKWRRHNLEWLNVLDIWKAWLSMLGAVLKLLSSDARWLTEVPKLSTDCGWEYCRVGCSNPLWMASNGDDATLDCWRYYSRYGKLGHPCWGGMAMINQSHQIPFHRLIPKGSKPPRGCDSPSSPGPCM